MIWLRRPNCCQIWHTLLCYLLVQPLLLCFGQQRQYKLIDVSAMCSSNGITAQMMFDAPFNGKIYSSRYVTVHNCVYYNHYGENMILFSIPIWNCGTVIEKNNQNIISHIENEVYVQFDKETQNIDDRRYLFVCDRSQTSSSLYRGTLRPGQTVIVHVLATGGESVVGYQKPAVWMEIREGNSPGRPVIVRRPLQLGDSITLVVSGRSNRPSSDFDIFVHSCFASDGSGTNKIELTDTAGCTVRTKLADQMKRRKDENNIISYYLPLQAFKFPTANDVYFSCSVDICGECSFPELCAAGKATEGGRGRVKRIPFVNITDAVYSDNILVHDSVQILDKGDNQNYSSDITTCFTQAGLALLMSIFGMLVLCLICVTTCTVRLYQMRRKSTNVN